MVPEMKKAFTAQYNGKLLNGEEEKMKKKKKSNTQTDSGRQ